MSLVKLCESNATLADSIDAVSEECSAMEHECMDILSKSSESVDGSRRVPQVRNASGYKFQFPLGEDQGWMKADQRLLSEISGNSSSLAELMSSACDKEMGRTRAMDLLLEEAEERLEVKVKQIKEMSQLIVEIHGIRKEYDSQLADDFNCLSDLCLTMESLEGEVERVKKSKRVGSSKKSLLKFSPSSSVVVPIRESTLQLQDQVARLEQELACKQEYYELELRRAQEELKDTKSRKIRMKSNFQQKLKGIFKDLDFISDRTGKCEASLEKAHLHYQLEEEEIVSIVSPIIESIDRVTEKVEFLAQDAEKAFYNTNSSDI